MKTIFKITLFILLGLSLNSCSERIVGTWKIQKYETIKPEQEPVSLNNIGTITFRSNGNGVNNISYTLFGLTKEDKLFFTWRIVKDNVTIVSEGSEFAKTWVIIDYQKDFQKWKSINTNNQVETLELIK
jgi:hypothetical protein